MAKIKRLPKSQDDYLEAEALNIRTYYDFYNRLAKLALSMFEWSNLPSSMDGQFLEYCLFAYGQASLLYYQDYGGFINTQCSTHGKLNIYRKPISLECYGLDELRIVRSVYNGLSKPDDQNKECILVENTFDRIPTAPTLDLYAMRLAEIQRSEDVNIKNQKFPFFITTDQKQLLTVKTIYKQYAGNTPVIISDKNGLTGESFKTMKTDSPYIADKLQEYRLRIFNEALSYLGINNINEKKERQLTDEINKNNEEVNFNLQSYLVPRQRAAKQFNDKYGFTGTDKEISVKVRSDLKNIIKQEESIVKQYQTITDEEKVNG